MNRLDKFEEILKPYKGRKQRVISKTEAALEEIQEIDSELYESVVSLDAEMIDMIIDAYNMSKSRQHPAHKLDYCHNIKMCLRKNPEKAYDFAASYIKELRE